MLLKDYIKVKKELGETNFSGISFDSSKIKKDYIFFAIKGDKFDGNDYVEKAIKKGAKIIITEKKNLKKKNKILFLFSSNIRKLLAEVSYKIFKEKPKKLVAVTGTNGKSSVSDFYFQILKLNAKRVASVGSIGVKYGNRKKFLTNTTLDPIKLGFLLNDLKKKKLNF